MKVNLSTTMFIFPLPLFSFLLFSITTTTTTAQPYKPTDYFLLNCGGATATTDRKWDTDERSEFMPSTTTSFKSTPNNHDPSVPEIPYSTARIFITSFTYTFPVANGPKFLRLYFYPATYSHYKADQSFFAVSSNGYSLLSNFSAFQTSSYLRTTRTHSNKFPHFVKEFVIYVNHTQTINITFTPSPESYAFINGIEIVSQPKYLYYKSKNVKYVGQYSDPVVSEDTCLENIYRLNVGGELISPIDDTGMYRSWDQDDPYLFPVRTVTPVNKTPIVYTADTPNYTAPELVYATQRSMGASSVKRNLTWQLPVDSGFYYNLRLHFCNIIPDYTRKYAVIFKIFISNQTAEEYADLFYWTKGTGFPVFKDYGVFVYDFDGSGRKRDLWLAMGPNGYSQEYYDAFLNGLEVFKLSMNGSLTDRDSELRPMGRPPSSPVKNKTPLYAAIIGGIGGAVVLMLSTLGFIVFQRVKHSGNKSSGEQKSKDNRLPSGRCRRFTIKEVKDATREFDKNCIIGRGGFGMVYKGYIDNATTTVAIKRLNALSKQGFHEFQMGIGLLSKLRHVQLVSLIGYCDDEGEMVLVYDYMSHGTLQDHLYKGNNPNLPWKRRLEICIGAAKGLDYLHTGANRAIIHRDVKSTNILLDENWVAKVADFGLSKLGPKDKGVDHVSTAVKGTFGYMDPEYYKMQQLTEKSDVYSFGVVLLEVLCSRPVIINQGVSDEEVSLAEWGRLNYGKGTLKEIVDKRISDEIAPNCLMKFGEVANSCLRMKGSKRPKMDEVVWGLEFALRLQEAAEKRGGMVGEMTGSMSENQEYMFPVKGEDVSVNEEYELEGSTGVGIQHGLVSTDSSSREGLVSETVLPK
ncbi:receptor-like protein kinase FERONIA [Lactuca sativa]|nr:receptor-like protein kinase FERONIA [Lactuca sativa]